MTLYVKKRIPVKATQVSKESHPFPEAEYDRIQEFTNKQFRYLITQVEPIATPVPKLKVVAEEFYVFDELHDTWVKLKRGDWIVRGIRGEFYPVEEAVFAETYEVFTDE